MLAHAECSNWRQTNLRNILSGKAIDYITLEVNQAFETLLNAPRASVIGKKASEILPPDELNKWVGIFGPVALTGKSTRYDLYSPRNQKIFEGLAYCPEPGKFAVTFSDVTTRKQAEETRSLLAAIANSSSDAILTKDLNGNITSWNKGAERIYGYTADEIIGKPIALLIPADMPNEFASIMDCLQDGKPIQNYETLRVAKNGKRLSVSLTISPLRDADGKIFGASTIGRDITERKRAEQQLRESNSTLETLIHVSPLAVILLDQTDCVQIWNPAAEKIFGWTAAEVVGQPNPIVPPQKQNEYALFSQQILSGGAITNVEAVRQHKDGSLIQVSLSSAPVNDAEGEVIGRMAIVADITERKKAEAQLHQSEEKFAKAFFTSPDAVTITRLRDGLYLEVNRGFAEMFGYTAESMRGKTVFDIDIWVHPQNRAQLVQELQTRGEVSNHQVDLRAKDGSIKTALVSAVCMPIDNELCMLAITRDITERQRAEEARRQSEEQFRSVVQTANDAIISEDETGTVIFWNRAAEIIFGYTADEMLGKSLNLIIPARFRELHWQGLQDTLANGKLSLNGKSVELIGQAKNGREFPIELSLAQWQTHNGIFFTAIIRDISARKRAEAELRESEASLKFSQQIAHVGHWTWDTQSNQLAWSDEMYRIFGIDPKTFSGDLAHVIDQAIHPDDRAKVNASNQNVLTEQKPAPIEYRVVWADGSVHTLWAVPGAQETDGDGKILRLSGTVQDITDRVRIEDALRESEEKYRTITEQMTDVVYVTDREGILKFISLAAQSVFGYAPEEMVDHPFAEFLVDTEIPKAFDAFRQSLATGQPANNLELWMKRKDGTVFIGELNGKFRPNDPRQETFGVIRDITDRKKRERELEAIATVTSALRTATTRDDMMPVIVEQTSNLLNTEAAAIGLYVLHTNESIIQYANGKWSSAIGRRTPANQGVSSYILTHKRPYLTDNLANDPLFMSRDLIGEIRGMGCMPLIANGEVIGWLFAGVRATLTDSDIRILQAIADIAASAINRATLHEQTQERIRRLDALQVIDRTINASLDLQVTLSILINQVLGQLNADAATVLLFNRQNRILTCAAAKGFRKHGVAYSNVQLGLDTASRAILERRLIQISNLNETPGALGRADRLANEGFVSYYAIPLVAKGQVKGVLEIFHRARHTPQPDWLEFSKALAEQAAIAVDNGELFADLQHSNDELIVAYDTTIEGWARALDLRDKETEGHTRRVVDNTLRLARMMGFKEDQMIHLQRGALLHDIGKMGIPDAILFKPGALTPEEWEIMQMHPVYAQQLLSSIPYLQPAVDISYCHHEKWDGTGYPRGLKGEEIPLAARIFSIVDVWDALRSNRPYRPAWSDEKIYQYLREESGKHFDPRVVEAFLALMQET